jgi:anthranilate synthase component 1
MTSTAQVTPTLDEFVELAKQGNVIPVLAEFIADGETPVSAFKKLDRGGYNFLFESTEKNDVSGRFSFIGRRSSRGDAEPRTGGPHYRARKGAPAANKRGPDR